MVVTITTSVGLFTAPSLTTSCARYSPSLSATNVGMTDVGLARVVVLAAGRAASVQENVRELPSASLEALPFRVTVLPATMVWSAPALATGGVFPCGGYSGIPS